MLCTVQRDAADCMPSTIMVHTNAEKLAQYRFLHVLGGKIVNRETRTFAAFFVKALLLSDRIPDAGCVGEDKKGF